MPTCGQEPSDRMPLVWISMVVEHQQPQRCQLRQHSDQRAVVVLPDAPQRQARQAAEPRPVLQLHPFWFELRSRLCC
jgi:hypothetical protein